MEHWATKTPQERQEAEDERLVRPHPPDKPPRHDLRQERVKDEPSETDDSSDKKDRSKNYKSIGGSLVERVMRAAKDRIPARSRETGEVVNISPDTLKKEPGKYEPVDKDEEKEEGVPKPKVKQPGKGEPEAKPPDERDAFYQKAGDALREMAQADPKLESKLHDFGNQNSQLFNFHKENPAFPAAQLFHGIKLPEGLNTLGDIKEALSKASKPKAKKKKKTPSEPPSEPAAAEPPKEAPTSEEAPKEPPKAKKPPKKKDEEKQEESAPEPAAPAPEPTESQKAGIPDPKRRPVNSAEKEEALSLLVDTFPPHISAELIAKNFHPDDVKTLIRDYNSAKVGVGDKNLGELASKVSEFFQTDPSRVKPPTTAKNHLGERVSFDTLPPEEQAEATRKHQLQIAAMSLAAQDLLTSKLSDVGSLSKKARIPKPLASTLASLMLSKVPPDQVPQMASDTFDTTMKSGSSLKISDGAVKRLLKQVKSNPAAQAIAKAYLQANDYGVAKEKFLKSGDELTEWSDPKDIVKGLQKTGQFFDQRNALYGDISTHPASTFFRIRLLNRLRALDPKKAKAVTATLPDLEEAEYQDHHKKWEAAYKKWSAKSDEHTKAVEEYAKDPTGKEPPGEFAEPEPMEPQRPARRSSPEEGAELWKAVFEPEPPAEPEEKPAEELDPKEQAAVDEAVEKAWAKGEKKAGLVFTYPFVPVMGSASKTGVYHGVDPYAYGPPAYPGWLQPHQRDLGEADFKTILGDAKDWLKSPLLTQAVDGMVPDTKFRVALDLAIYAGPYNQAIDPNTYNQLLADLAGKTEPGKGETLMTLQASETSFRTSDVYMAVYGKTALTQDILRVMEAFPFRYQDDGGAWRGDGRVEARLLKQGSPTAKEASDGMVPEALVKINFPVGSEEAALKAANSTLQHFNLRGEKVTSNYRPSSRKGASDDTSTFRPSPSDSTGGSISMKASTEIRKFAAQAANSDSKLAFEMLAFADRLAEEEKKMPPWLEKKVEDKGDEKKEEKKEASDRYARLRSEVIKLAATQSPEARAAMLPLLQTIKSLG